ncbi:hypothetical protein B484DRAFT_482666 [Ochromonadaceae sp. CCMP2298]|nr:hypothetical protein B484DRAFT_482666 [Ochromonadaceae sp. CCMP2298]
MTNVAIALLSIVLCWLSPTEAQKAAEDAEMPRAIIHIGPHKTATTSVQAMLTSAEKRMQADNTYWPAHGEVVQFSRSLSEVSNQGFDSVTQMGRFINESRSHGRNVILSTENFIKMPPHKISVLKDMLQGFDVTIIAVYREYISHMISFHYQENRWYNGHHEPISQYIMGLDFTDRGRDYMSLLGDWGQVFGKDALKIVDYYGAIAAGKSVPRVVLCEAADVLCDAEEGDSHANVGDSLEPTQVFTEFCKFTARQPGAWESCQSPIHSEKNENMYFHSMGRTWEPTDLVAFFRKAFETRPPQLHKLPTVNSKLTYLVEHSSAMDATLREGYGENILYSNASANLQHAQNSIHVEEVDFEILGKKSQWSEWMRGVYDDAVRQKLLCNRDIQK